jgi:DNA-3-methyladenine glycosylase
VLLRAGRVTEGADLAAARRTARRSRPARPPVPRDLARGPARLCQALGIDRDLDGADVCQPGSALVVTGPAGAAGGISQGPRIGISRATELPWRFWVTGDPAVTPFRPYQPRRRN